MTPGFGDSRSGRVLLLGAKILLSVGMFAFLFHRVSFDQLRATWRDVRPEWLIAAWLLLFASNLLGTFQWSRLLRVVEIQIPFWKVCAYYHVGLFFNNFLPANIGGDIARVSDASRYGPTKTAALSAVLMDRLIGTISLAGLALLCTIPALDRFHMGLIYLALVGFFAFSVAVLWAVFHPALLPTVERLLARIGLARLGPHLDDLAHRLGGFRGRRGLFVGMFAVSTLTQLARIGVHVLVARSLGLNVSLTYFFLFVPLLAVIVSLPISLNGIGVREGAGIVLFGLVGVDRVHAFSLQFLTYVVAVAVSLLGGFVFLARNSSAPGASTIPGEERMAVTHRVIGVLSLVVFLIAATVYLITLTPTVPFWDSGEFIAVSNILGIPHPPGTPFYVLIGRIATMIPWASIAQRVNALSAISSALAVMLTFLTALKLIHLAQGKERTQSDEWIAIAGAAAGALLLAFSDSYWENSIEAEVYSMMSLAQILVFWLGLNWWEAHEERPTAGPLLLCVYVMWLCVGLHLGVAIMGLPLIVLVALVDRRAALVFAMPFLSSLAVTMGLERMAGAVLGLSTATFFVYAWQKKLGGWVTLASAAAALLGMTVAFGDKDFTAGTALIAAASILVPLALLARRSREGKILALALGLMVVGYSTHVYLPIRAAQHPAINEGNPATWNNLKDLLERKQYGSSSMFVRRGGPNWPVIQLDKEFWRYFKRQWLLFGDEHAGDGWSNGSAKGFSAFLAMLAYLVPPGAILPLAFGLIGGWWQARRNAISFWTTFVFLGLTTFGMVVFLNFSDHEVRERDYFFQSGFHAYALWIALGCAWFITWVRDSFAEGASRRYATAACSALVLAQPFLQMRNFWFTHDRRGNYVAHDYAYNMLAPLAKDSFVYTNGDNDTFPLWYMQQVENFRKDVRVVNLSLLNTDWYIYQLRDEAPTVPITLDNATINALGAGIIQDQQGNVIYTNRYMVDHIIREDRKPNGWKKQPYFAVTVPEHMDLDKNFTLEGLVYRVNPDTLGPEVDELQTRKAIYETFKYRGLFHADGSWDSTVYKDENASTLSRNYAAAHLQLGFWYQRRGESKKAIAEFERVERMFPGYADVGVPLGRIYLEAGDTTKAVQLFERLMKSSPGSPDVHYYYAVTQMFRGNGRAALQGFDQAIALDPEFFYAYLAAYSMLDENGQHEEAAKYLERWLARHPDDRQVRALLEGGHAAPEPPKPTGMIQGPPPQLP